MNSLFALTLPKHCNIRVIFFLSFFFLLPIVNCIVDFTLVIVIIIFIFIFTVDECFLQNNKTTTKKLSSVPSFFKVTIV